MIDYKPQRWFCGFFYIKCKDNPFIIRFVFLHSQDAVHTGCFCKTQKQPGF